MFTADVPTYFIDLERDEASRWDEVISREKIAARRLIEEAGSQFERVPELLRWIFARLYQRSGGLYRGEIASWAEALGVSLGTATILNCAYELSHLRWPKVFGCTAGLRGSMAWAWSMSEASTGLWPQWAPLPVYFVSAAGPRVRLGRSSWTCRRSVGHAATGVFRDDQLGSSRSGSFLRFRSDVSAARHPGDMRQLRGGGPEAHTDAALHERFLYRLWHRQGPGMRHRTNAKRRGCSQDGRTSVGSGESPCR